MFVQIIAAAVMMQAAPAASTEAWTWTLYQGDGPTVLANEIPDTPRLKSTLECANGTGVARVTLYNSALAAGFATLTAGAGGHCQPDSRQNDQSGRAHGRLLKSSTGAKLCEAAEFGKMRSLNMDRFAGGADRNTQIAIGDKTAEDRMIGAECHG